MSLQNETDFDEITANVRHKQKTLSLQNETDFDEIIANVGHKTGNIVSTKRNRL